MLVVLVNCYALIRHPSLVCIIHTYALLISYRFLFDFLPILGTIDGSMPHKLINPAIYSK